MKRAETIADNILKASGSALHHYSMPKTRESIIAAAQDAISLNEELVAWAHASPHKGFCSRFNNPKSDHKCGCGRDELIAKACGEK